MRRTISQVAEALSNKGCELGSGYTDLKAQVTYYEVLAADGTKKRMTAQEVVALANWPLDKTPHLWQCDIIDSIGPTKGAPAR